MIGSYRNTCLTFLFISILVGTYKSENIALAGGTGMSWIRVAEPLPWSPSVISSAVVFDGKMWITTYGVGEEPSAQEVWSSTDGKEWTQATAAVPWSPRHSYTSVVFDDRMWVLGGGQGSTHFNDVWFSSDGASWAQAPAPPWSPRASHTSVVFDGRMWVMGGGEDQGLLNDVWSSADGNAWTQATSAAAWLPRSAHVSVVFDGKMWVITGRAGGVLPEPVVEEQGDAWSSPDGVEWTQEKSGGPPSVSHAVAAVFDNRIWVMGGGKSGDPGPTITNAIWTSSDGVAWELQTFETIWPPSLGSSALVFVDTLWVLGIEIWSLRQLSGVNASHWKVYSADLPIE